MIHTIFTMLPVLSAFCAATVITYLSCKLWFAKSYVHRNEVKPLQESQHIMQNQYAALAERIKHAEALLTETKQKLETEIANHLEAKIKLAEAEAGLRSATSSAAITSEQSKQVWQLLELNKKLSAETEALNTLLASQMISTRKSTEDHFTLASIQKRG